MKAISLLPDIKPKSKRFEVTRRGLLNALTPVPTSFSQIEDYIAKLPPKQRHAAAWIYAGTLQFIGTSVDIVEK